MHLVGWFICMMHKVHPCETTEYHLILADWTVMDIFQCTCSGLLQSYTHAGRFCFISIRALTCNTACNFATRRVVRLHRVNVVFNMLECQVGSYEAGWRWLTLTEFGIRSREYLHSTMWVGPHLPTNLMPADSSWGTYFGFTSYRCLCLSSILSLFPYNCSEI
jgi:hypothetical protein